MMFASVVPRLGIFIFQWLWLPCIFSYRPYDFLIGRSQKLPEKVYCPGFSATGKRHARGLPTYPPTVGHGFTSTSTLLSAKTHLPIPLSESFPEQVQSQRWCEWSNKCRDEQKGAVQWLRPWYQGAHQIALNSGTRWLGKPVAQLAIVFGIIAGLDLPF